MHESILKLFLQFRSSSFLYLFFKNSFIYLFLTVLGLPCCMGFSLVAESRCYSLVAVYRLLIAVGSPVTTHRALEHRLNSFGAWAWLLHGTWNIPRSAIKPVHWQANPLPLSYQRSPDLLHLFPKE